MSLNAANAFPRIKRRLSPSSWSITTKLTILYALSAFAMLALASGFLHWVLIRNLMQEDNQFLTDKIHVIRALLKRHPNDQAALQEEIQWEGETFRLTRYYARILTPSSRLLIETPGMTALIAPSDFASPTALGKLPKRGVLWQAPHGATFLTMSAHATTGGAHPAQRLIQVALSTSREDRLVTDYRQKLLAVLALGVVISSILGFLLARKGMRPLREITRTAQRITSSQLHERIDATRWPRELTALAAAFDEMLDRLEESFSRLRQFSADLAHELRTPVNVLMGEAEVALSRPRPAEELRQTLESSLEEYGRLARMIDSLLFLARADSGKAPIQRTMLDAYREMETVRDFYDAVAAEQGITITCHGSAALYADPALLRRALSNVLANALRHSAPGGAVTLHARTLPGPVAELTVSDHGDGIDARHLPKIFDRFYRADSARAADASGAGLGLAIVKSIMTLHEGEVTFHSQPGRGTTVTLRFPAAAPSLPGAP